MSARGANIIKRTHNLFEEIGRDTRSLPSCFFADDKPISVVFAGQYSAGKSSIIKALTGIEDIEIGHGITTQKATTYPWRGLTVTDTPGIGTGLHPEHDEISLRAILSADILVYVVTNEGFDNLIAEEFRNLIFDKDKAHETVLVVNKMERTTLGNTLEQRQVISEDLRKVTDPLTPKELHVVFVDAKAYLKSIEIAERNPRRSEKLLRASNMQDLIRALDNAALECSLTPRITPPLDQTLNELDKALAEIDGATGSYEEHATKEALLRECEILSDSYTRTESKVYAAYSKAGLEIRKVGRELSRSVGTISTPEEAQEAKDKVTLSVQQIESKCIETVRKELSAGPEQCRKDLQQFCFSFSSEFQRRLGANDGPESLARVAANKAIEKNIFEQATDLINHFAADNKRNSSDTVSRLFDCAGTAANIAGIVLPLFLEAKDEISAHDQAIIEKREKEKILALFSKEAKDLEDLCEAELATYEHERFRPKFDDIQERIAAHDSEHVKKSGQNKELVSLRNECVYLLREIRQWTYVHRRER